MSEAELNKFWEDVASATRGVELNHEREVVVLRQQRKATVTWSSTMDAVLVIIEEADTSSHEELVSP